MWVLWRTGIGKVNDLRCRYLYWGTSRRGSYYEKLFYRDRSCVYGQPCGVLLKDPEPSLMHCQTSRRATVMTSTAYHCLPHHLSIENTPRSRTGIRVKKGRVKPWLSHSPQSDPRTSPSAALAIFTRPSRQVRPQHRRAKFIYTTSIPRRASTHTINSAKLSCCPRSPLYAEWIGSRSCAQRFS